MKKSTSGFTIVELLIVIVIIGILSALIIAAYTGMQARANNGQTIAAVATYTKALRNHVTEHGKWPAANYVCMGEYTGSCGQHSATTPSCASGLLHCYAGQSTTLNASLKPYYNNATITPPSLQLVTINVPTVGSVVYKGAVVNISSETSAMAYIRYYLKGSDSPCGAPGGLRGIKDTGFTGDTSCYVAIPFSE